MYAVLTEIIRNLWNFVYNIPRKCYDSYINEEPVPRIYNTEYDASHKEKCSLRKIQAKNKMDRFCCGNHFYLKDFTKNREIALYRNFDKILSPDHIGSDI